MRLLVCVIFVMIFQFLIRNCKTIIINFSICAVSLSVHNFWPHKSRWWAIGSPYVVYIDDKGDWLLQILVLDHRLVEFKGKVYYSNVCQFSKCGQVGYPTINPYNNTMLQYTHYANLWRVFAVFNVFLLKLFDLEIP